MLGLFFFSQGFISSLEGALSSEAWLSECPGDFVFRVTLDLGATLSPRMGPEVRHVIKFFWGGVVELIWAGLLPGQPCSHPRSVNELGTGEPHTFQLASLQWHPGVYGELLMEGAGFVLIRTSFQLPSVRALQPLSGQPHPPPHQLAT